MPENDEQWNDGHRAFLQAFMSRSTLTLEEARPLLAAILTAYEIAESKETLPEDVTEADFNSYISAANTRISPFDLEIRSTFHQISRTRTYALINSTSDPIIQLATVHTAEEISFLKRVLDAMFETYNTARHEIMAITAMQAVRLNKPSENDRRETQNGTETQGSAGQGLKMVEAERMLKTLVEEGWFEKSKKGYYRLSPRALMELRGWLIETYNDVDEEDEEEERLPRIKQCAACKEIVTMGQRCTQRNCPCRLHDICTQNFFRMQRSRNCPLCKTEWSGKDFVGERAVLKTHKQGSRRSRGIANANTSRAMTDEPSHVEDKDDEIHAARQGLASKRIRETRYPLLEWAIGEVALRDELEARIHGNILEEASRSRYLRSKDRSCCNPALHLCSSTQEFLRVLHLASHIIEPAFISPLSKVPSANFLSSISPVWINWIRRVNKETRTIYTLHQKHGPVVRLGPNEISVNAESGLKTVYYGGFEKHRWYADNFVNFRARNTFTSLDHKTHSVRKRSISNLYSKSYLHQSPDLRAISNDLILKRFLPTIDTAAHENQPLDIFDMAQALGMDFVSAYLLGSANGTNFLKDIEYRHHWIARYALFFSQSPEDRANGEIEEWCMALCKAAEEMEQSEKDITSTEPLVHAKLFHYLQSNGTDPRHVSKVVASEMLDQFIAGHETSAITLTYLAYELSQRPLLQKRLREELLTLSPRIQCVSSDAISDDDHLPSPRAIDALPLLDAILHETLRLYSAGPGPQPRVTPSIPGGTTIEGYANIPGGVRISSNPFSMHRIPEVFPEPHAWLPERWLQKDQKKLEQMRRAFFAFGAGGRMCLGKNFAMQVLVLLCHALLVDALTSADSIVRQAADARHSYNPSDVYETRFENVTWDNAAWQVRTTIPDPGHYQSRQSVANGYIGISVSNLGPFFEQDEQVNGDNINGWPLFQERISFATVGGFFDQQPTTNGTNFEWMNQYGGESVISGIPHWSGIVLDLGDDVFLDASVDPAEITNFRSTLNAKAGVSTWHFTWVPADRDGNSFDITYIMFAHKLYVNQAFVQLQITPSADSEASIANILDGTSAVRTSFVSSGMDESLIYTAVSPNGVSNVTAYIYAAMAATEEVDVSTLMQVMDRAYLGVNDSSVAQAASASLKANTATVITKYVGIASSDGFTDPQEVAKAASLTGLSAGFDQSISSHIWEWSNVFPDDSADNYTYPQNNTLPSDPFIVESAITGVLNEYYLLQNTIGQNALDAANNAPIDSTSISVGGLASDSYAGMVFWDAEIWMQPGIAASHPQAVKQIANYRVARYAQAKENAQTAYKSSKNTSTFSDDAAVFPWTSGRTGNCTGTGPCFDYEYHINGDIAQEFANYWVTSGDTEFFREQLFPIYNSVAVFYSELVEKNGSSYVLNNMTDPDEYANHVDNGGFTMPLIADTLMFANMFRGLFGVASNSTWDEQAENIFIERNAEVGIIEEYTGMNGSIEVKQADVVLNIFPLNYQNQYTATDRFNDLTFYAGKQSLSGPGMTYAIFSIAASEVDPSGCSSYTYQQYSEQPYARAPWFQFSEQLTDDYTTNGGTHPAFPFLTGHGGANQVTLFGYLGLRLTPDFTLHLNPSLPPQIPNLRYRTFYWQGWPISAIANQTHTTITRLSEPYIAANQTFAQAAIPVQIGNDDSNMHQLQPNGTIVLPNRDVASLRTVEGNIAQCQPVTSPDEYLPGQFPFAAVDGSRTTKWQPNAANTSQSITVSLSTEPIQPVAAFHFDWAQTPPTNITVIFHNASEITDSSAVPVVDNVQVSISMPYDANSTSLITPYMSNTTNITLPAPVYSGQYATLQIQGNQVDSFNNGTGGSVAEWVILGPNGQALTMEEPECSRQNKNLVVEALEELVGKRPSKDEGEQKRMKEDVVDAPVGKTEL
ncbi:MAG: hypothetical protein Q9173_004907 [Seirophora scorigena]